jgi:hypothetical protein
MNAFFGRGDRWRLLTRLLGVLGVLLLVLTWRLDQAVHTAYVSGWTGQTIKLEHCGKCRLPGHGWLFLHGAAGMLAVICFVGALSIWLWRKPGTAPLHLKWICAVTAGIAFALEVGAAYLRDLADRDTGSWPLGAALACDAAALALLAIFLAAIVAANGEGNLRRVRRFFQRHGLSLVGVTILAFVTDVVAQTSGQTIDSVRGWLVWSDQGMSRLAFGLVTSVLLALVVYESGIRLEQIEVPTTGLNPVRKRWWFGVGLPLLVGGIALGSSCRWASESPFSGASSCYSGCWSCRRSAISLRRLLNPRWRQRPGRTRRPSTSRWFRCLRSARSRWRERSTQRFPTELMFMSGRCSSSFRAWCSRSLQC